MGVRWLEDLVRDLRHAGRGLRRSPGLLAAVTLILALGIGATTSAFSIIYNVLLRPLPYPDADAIVRVGEVGPRGVPALTNRSLPLLETAASFEQLAAFQPASARWDGAGGITLVGASVSPTLFRLLRAAPHAGRLFLEGEARAGAQRVVLLSHRAWTSRFGSNPDIVGTPIRLNGAPHMVIGVLTEGFYFPSPDSEFWMPFIAPPVGGGGLGSGGGVSETSFGVIGRLRRGVSPDQATAEARGILQEGSGGRVADLRDVRVIPLREELVGEYRPALLMLATATGLVLLVACLNVAGLLLVHGVVRRRMLAIGAALGATPARLVRRLLIESTLLSVGGGMLGVIAAAVMLRVVPALVPADVPGLDNAEIDGVVVAFAAVLVIIVGVLCGASVAFQRSRADLAGTLYEGATQSASGYRWRGSYGVRAVLAAMQVALALWLLVGAGLLLRSFVQLITFDRGFDPAGVVVAVVENPVTGAGPPSLETIQGMLPATLRQQERLLGGLEARLASLREVAAFGLSWNLPFLPVSASDVPLRAAGMPARGLPDTRAGVPTHLHVASSGYFEALRFRLLDGRFFTRLDGPGSPRVMLVNETLARDLFGGGGSAIGRRVVAGRGEPWEVVGVVGNVVYGGLELTSEPRAEAFFPFGQIDNGTPIGLSSRVVVSVRTAGDPMTVVPFLREAIIEANPRAVITRVTTMEALLSAAVVEPRFYASLVSSLAWITLIIAAFGIYALLAETVVNRRKEIAIRMVLGAGRREILWLIVGGGAAIVGVGAVVGLGTAAVSSRALASLLYGVAASDWVTFVLALVVLTVVALCACWIPARWATRVDPASMLGS